MNRIEDLKNLGLEIHSKKLQLIETLSRHTESNNIEWDKEIFGERQEYVSSTIQNKYFIIDVYEKENLDMRYRISIWIMNAKAELYSFYSEDLTSLVKVIESRLFEENLGLLMIKVSNENDLLDGILGSLVFS